MKVHFKKAAKKGFSLVELLVVIAVIGIMAAIAIPMISNINENARTAKNKRNAQNIASVYGSAAAAGATDIATAPLSKTAIGDAIDSLQAGVVGDGQFSTTTFRVSVTDDEATLAQRYLTLTNGVMVYNADAPATVTPPPVE